jgi:hypothetical protein
VLFVSIAVRGLFRFLGDPWSIMNVSFVSEISVVHVHRYLRWTERMIGVDGGTIFTSQTSFPPSWSARVPIQHHRWPVLLKESRTFNCDEIESELRQHLA